MELVALYSDQNCPWFDLWHVPFLSSALQVDGEASSLIVNYFLGLDGNLKLTMNVCFAAYFRSYIWFFLEGSCDQHDYHP